MVSNVYNIPLRYLQVTKIMKTTSRRKYYDFVCTYDLVLSLNLDNFLEKNISMNMLCSKFSPA